MLTFNSLLLSEGIDPKQVTLIRHQESKHPGRTPYDLWRAADGRFEKYHCLQGKPRFKIGELLATFVATPLVETLFVRLYRVDSFRAAPEDAVCPIRLAPPKEGAVVYEMIRDDRLARYEGLLIVDWGAAFIVWTQSAIRNEKPVLEIRKDVAEPSFPGFKSFCQSIAEVPSMPFGWREALRSVNGIYLLVCNETGEQYVGSAFGTDGLLGRFLEYARTGHGGNVELRQRGNRNYQVCVLEVFSPSVDIDEVLNAESIWKRKLGSRAHGLNSN